MQQLNTLYLQIAQLIFTEIRNLSFGRASLQMNSADFSQDIPTEQAINNLFIIGQLSEAMHNLPTDIYSDDYAQYLTLKNMSLFFEKNPQYQKNFEPFIEQCFKLNHQVLAKIDADFVANIADKYQKQHK